MTKYTDREYYIDDFLVDKMDLAIERYNHNRDSLFICDGSEGDGKSTMTFGLAYYKRIDDILTYCMESRMANNGINWHKGIQSLYCEVFAKMSEQEKIDATKMLNILTTGVKENSGKNRTISTQLFIDLELFLRMILEKKGMLTPKRDTSGL